jgi:ribose-phosphate pyrophosphokinase
MKQKVPNPKIFACSQSIELAEKIANAFGTELGKSKKNVFSDGEFLLLALLFLLQII